MNMSMNEKMQAAQRIFDKIRASDPSKLDITVKELLEDKEISDWVLQATIATNLSIISGMANFAARSNPNRFFRGDVFFTMTPSNLKLLTSWLNQKGRTVDTEQSVMNAIGAMIGDGFLSARTTAEYDSNGCHTILIRCTKKVLKKYRHMLDR